MTKEIRKWLSDYEDGIEIESVDMGGMGDRYESAIQECAIETMRNLPNDVPEDTDQFSNAIKLSSDYAVKILNGFHGFSGAQVGAAGNMAAVFFRKTPEKALESMRNSDPHRIIKIKKGANNRPEIIRSIVEENQNS